MQDGLGNRNNSLDVGRETGKQVSGKKWSIDTITQCNFPELKNLECIGNFFFYSKFCVMSPILYMVMTQGEFKEKLAIPLNPK